MKTVTLFADWSPLPEFKIGKKDVEGKLTYLGSKVWKNPRAEILDKDKPKIGPSEVLIRVKACGICGSDVHMAQAQDNGYIFYPGLTAFPVTLGHEFAGIVEDAGENAINKRTGYRFEKGEPVCAEEMAWCGICKPCCDGYPNHCERLQEIGFTIEGAYAEFIKIDAKYCWSLEPLKNRYKNDDIFLAGSLVEPTSVAYNALIERGRGIRPGENAVIFGGGPIGLAGVAILKAAGASKVILSEPSKIRSELGKSLGADFVINPLREAVADMILEYTDGMGAKIFLEATGLPDIVVPQIEDVIWQGRTLNSVVVIVARADAKIPVSGEVFQVRRASIIGSQGHSGHGNFSNVISLMARGMDLTPIITKKINIDEAVSYLKILQTNKDEAKVTIIFQ